MVLEPTRSGIELATQVPVPEAHPESPAELDHFTPVTPTLSEAAPRSAIADAFVETIVEAGLVIVKEGGTESAPY